ncbi:MAG: universal stress protein [Kiritimatiellae bacterium]|nr:universal stress protein [Kiritimatiellia bacterium]
MKLLVALDFSDASAPILEHARQLAQAASGSVWLLHVAAPDPDFVGYEVGPQHVRDNLATEFHKEHQKIQTMAETLRTGGIDATGLLLQGPTAETILREAERLNADMIVVGSHGHGAVHQLLVGSVAEPVLRKSSRPVIVVPIHHNPTAD